MKIFKHLSAYFLLCCAVILLQAQQDFAQSDSKTASQQITGQRDGQKDFDFEIGTWKTRLKRLVKPLSGSSE